MRTSVVTFVHFINHLGQHVNIYIHSFRASTYKIIDKEGPSCGVVLILETAFVGKMDLAVLKLAQLMALKSTIIYSLMNSHMSNK